MTTNEFKLHLRTELSINNNSILKHILVVLDIMNTDLELSNHLDRHDFDRKIVQNAKTINGKATLVYEVVLIPRPSCVKKLHMHPEFFI